MIRNSRLGFKVLLLLTLLMSLSGCIPEVTDSGKPPAMYWLEDKAGTMTLEEVRNKNLATDWGKSYKENPNFGFVDSTFWLSLPFENHQDKSASMLLDMAFPLHDSLDVYLLDGDEVVESFRTGDNLTASQRPLAHRNFLFPYTLEPNEKLRAIVRVQSTDTMYFPVKVWESNDFFSKDEQQVLLLGLFFGFLLIMLVYNLLLYCSTKDKNYLYYAWCGASIIYMQLAQKGLGYQYLWPDQIEFNMLSIPLATFATISSSLFFILKFLELDSQHRKTIFIFQTFIWISLVGVFWMLATLASNIYLIPYTAMLLIIAFLGIVTTVTILVLLIRLSIEGSDTARVLSIAWVSLLAGSVLFILGRLGVPLPMVLAENSMLFGSTFEAALISFALARHIKKERDARMLAQESALCYERETREAQHLLMVLQDRTRQQLEQEVQERTIKLETAMQELTQANHKLDNLARLDSLTGLSNRRNFDQEIADAWRTKRQEKQPISMLMADIDHFKMINDTYGHLFGDQCLIKVASILEKCITDPSHLAARFGGEEFIIMLPGATAAKAEGIAESIRRDIEKLRLNYDGRQIKFTISIGVASIVPASGVHSTDLNERADQALYLAKEGGRNRVVIYENESSLMETS